MAEISISIDAYLRSALADIEGRIPENPSSKVWSCLTMPSAPYFLEEARNKFGPDSE